MAEIADGLINGDFDFYTGEYLGRGYGIPRTHNKSLTWEKSKNERRAKDFLSSKDVAFDGIKNYIAQRWNGRKDIPSVRSLMYEYTGESNFDLKQRCLEVQKDFKAFIEWINEKINSTK
jgi:hypothetical protein